MGQKWAPSGVSGMYGQTMIDRFVFYLLSMNYGRARTGYFVHIRSVTSFDTDDVLSNRLGGPVAEKRKIPLPARSRTDDWRHRLKSSP